MTDWGAHHFGGATFAIDVREGSRMEVSLRTLPDRPTVVVLRPEFLRDE